MTLDLSQYRQLLSKEFVEHKLEELHAIKTDVEEIIFGKSFSLGPYAFEGFECLKSVKNIRFANWIGKGCFINCSSLNDIDIRYTTLIDEKTFENCISLTNISIGNNCVIKDYAFSNCKSLKCIRNIQTVQSYASTAFNGCQTFDTSILPLDKQIKSVQEMVFDVVAQINDAINQTNSCATVDQKALLNAISPALKRNAIVEQLCEQMCIKVALCTIARLENRYIREFIDHYKAIGIDKIFLYDTNKEGEEKFEDAINDYIQSGFVEKIPYSGHQPTQEVLDAYAECYAQHKDEYDWICFFDPDEYLDLRKHYNIKEFLIGQSLKDADIVHINWQVYDDNGLLVDDGRLLNERFTTPCTTTAAEIENQRVKSIVRGGLDGIVFMTPHTPTTNYEGELTVCSASGKKVPNTFTNKIDFDVARLKHFRCKTITEYLENKLPKLMMYGYSNICFDDNFFFSINKWSQEKQDIYDNFIDKLIAKDYNTTKTYKYSVLTCVFGNSPTIVLRNPKAYDPDVEYICVTDRLNLKSSIWKVVQIKSCIDGDVAKWKYPKFHPFEYASSDICIYVDSSIQIENKLDNLVQPFKASNAHLGLMVHPNRNNIKDELHRWVEMREYPKDVGQSILDFYNEQHYTSTSLFFCCMIVYKKTAQSIQFGKDVWKMLTKFGINGDVSRSDQVFVPYAVDQVFGGHGKFDKLFVISPKIVNSAMMSRIAGEQQKKYSAPSNQIYLIDGKLVKPFTQ